MSVCRSKYKAKKVTVNGVTFHSQKEYRRFCELVLLERAGRIQDLQRQVKFVLIPTQYERFERYSNKTGKRLADGMRVAEMEVSYFADFVYTEDGKQVVEDSKGYRTADYIIKRKLMLQVHGIKIKET
jgi:hypothetical protein